MAFWLEELGGGDPDVKKRGGEEDVGMKKGRGG